MVTMMIDESEIAATNSSQQQHKTFSAYDQRGKPIVVQDLTAREDRDPSDTTGVVVPSSHGSGGAKTMGADTTAVVGGFKEESKRKDCKSQVGMIKIEEILDSRNAAESPFRPQLSVSKSGKVASIRTIKRKSSGSDVDKRALAEPVVVRTVEAASPHVEKADGIEKQAPEPMSVTVDKSPRPSMSIYRKTLVNKGILKRPYIQRASSRDPPGSNDSPRALASAKTAQPVVMPSLQVATKASTSSVTFKTGGTRGVSTRGHSPAKRTSQYNVSTKERKGKASPRRSSRQSHVVDDNDELSVADSTVAVGSKSRMRAVVAPVVTRNSPAIIHITSAEDEKYGASPTQLASSPTRQMDVIDQVPSRDIEMKTSTDQHLGQGEDETVNAVLPMVEATQSSQSAHSVKNAFRTERKVPAKKAAPSVVHLDISDAVESTTVAGKPIGAVEEPSVGKDPDGEMKTEAPEASEVINERNIVTSAKVKRTGAVTQDDEEPELVQLGKQTRDRSSGKQTRDRSSQLGNTVRNGVAILSVRLPIREFTSVVRNTVSAEDEMEQSVMQLVNDGGEEEEVQDKLDAIALKSYSCDLALSDDESSETSSANEENGKDSPDNVLLETQPVQTDAPEGEDHYEYRSDSGSFTDDNEDLTDDNGDEADSKVSVHSLADSLDTADFGLEHEEEEDNVYQSFTLPFVVRMLDKSCAWLEEQQGALPCNYTEPSLLNKSSKKWVFPSFAAGKDANATVAGEPMKETSTQARERSTTQSRKSAVAGQITSEFARHRRRRTRSPKKKSSRRSGTRDENNLYKPKGNNFERKIAQLWMQKRQAQKKGTESATDHSSSDQSVESNEDVSDDSPETRQSDTTGGGSTTSSVEHSADSVTDGSASSEQMTMPFPRTLPLKSFEHFNERPDEVYDLPRAFSMPENISMREVLLSMQKTEFTVTQVQVSPPEADSFVPENPDDVPEADASPNVAVSVPVTDLSVPEAVSFVSGNPVGTLEAEASPQETDNPVLHPVLVEDEPPNQKSNRAKLGGPEAMLSNRRSRSAQSASPSKRHSNKHNLGTKTANDNVQLVAANDATADAETSGYSDLNESERLAAIELADKLTRRAETLKRRRKKREQKLKDLEEMQAFQDSFGHEDQPISL